MRIKINDDLTKDLIDIEKKLIYVMNKLSMTEMLARRGHEDADAIIERINSLRYSFDGKTDINDLDKAIDEIPERTLELRDVAGRIELEGSDLMRKMFALKIALRSAVGKLDDIKRKNG